MLCHIRLLSGMTPDTIILINCYKHSCSLGRDTSLAPEEFKRSICGRGRKRLCTTGVVVIVIDCQSRGQGSNPLWGRIPLDHCQSDCSEYTDRALSLGR